MPSDLPFNSATDLAAAIRAREISPVEAMETYLARVDRFDPDLNAFALRDDERALSDARAATERVAATPRDELPPLFGVPVPVKDLNDVAGWPTTLGSFASSDEPKPTDSVPAARLRRAGAVLMGKTTTPEFGTVSFTESDRLGITRNPWDTGHTPGGSSGGAAAAVSSGMAPIAHASDGAGSIRIPASCCGLVGLKAGRHRIPGEFEEMAGGCTSGVRGVAPWRTPRSASTCCRRRTRTAGTWPLLPTARSSTRSVGTPVGFGCGCRSSRRSASRSSRRSRLRPAASPIVWTDLGHEVVEGPADVARRGRHLRGVHGDLVDRLGHLRPARTPTGSSHTTGRPRWGRPRTSTRRSMMKLQLATRLLAQQFDDDFDILLTPTMAVEPPKVGSWLENVPEDEPQTAIINCLPMGTFTAIFNLTGFPAISVPAEVGAERPPDRGAAGRRPVA